MQAGAWSIAARQFDFGDGDENVGARFQGQGFQQGLFLFRAEGAHHRQCIDQRLVGCLLNTFPVDLEPVRFSETAQGPQHTGAVHILASALEVEILREFVVDGDALPVGCENCQLFGNAKAGDAGVDQLGFYLPPFA